MPKPKGRNIRLFVPVTPELKIQLDEWAAELNMKPQHFYATAILLGSRNIMMVANPSKYAPKQYFQMMSSPFMSEVEKVVEDSDEFRNDKSHLKHTFENDEPSNQDNPSLPKRKKKLS